MTSFIPVHSRFGHSMQHVLTGRILDAVHKVVMCNSTSATKAGIAANVHPRAEGCFGLLAVSGELVVSFAYSPFISGLPLLITSLLHSRPCVYVGFRGVLRATRRLRNEVPAWLCVVVGAWLESEMGSGG